MRYSASKNFSGQPIKSVSPNCGGDPSPRIRGESGVELARHATFIRHGGSPFLDLVTFNFDDNGFLAFLGGQGAFCEYFVGSTGYRIFGGQTLKTEIGLSEVAFNPDA